MFWLHLARTRERAYERNMITPQQNKGKVIVGLSGGIDSAVAAALLKQQGYEVIGVTLSLFAYASGDGKGCCSFSDTIDATQVCDLLGIEHFVFSRRKSFGNEVINKFVEGHKNGEVVNPCVTCNNLIKIPSLVQAAMHYKADFIATGHYANVENGLLTRGDDLSKDQSYFLWELPTSIVSRMLFPLGKMTKPEVRKLAEKMGIHIAKKPDSVDLCFLEGKKASDYLAERGVGTDAGSVVDDSGINLGSHSGLGRYVVGQRLSIPSKDGKPKYVLKVIPETNTIVAGNREDAFFSSIKIKETVFHDKIQSVENISAVCRYQTDAVKVKSILPLSEEDSFQVELETPVYGVSRGQSLVFYRNNKEVVGGGIIQ
jgi:tRNA-specific 2-thiouridylase